MGCCGKAHWKREEVPDHKFDFIDVRDYWNNGYLTRIKYALLFANVAKSFAVYIADIYTAITLLAFHKFNGSIYNRVVNSPANTVKVPFDYGKWIFTGCIIFSFLLLAYEAHKTRAVIRSRDISYAYTNVMANDFYSMRSYNHFCFFCQINNSKKKKDELAFFIFFTFKGWKRLLVADGPRQVINALTLYALAEASDFSTNIEDYYEGNIFTAVMLITMLFTVLVFAGSAILLIFAALFYLPLICYIQGNLKEYCCHKIDKRISELVQKKKKQRLGKYAAIARAEAAGDFKHLMNKKGIIVGRKMVQPTLPQLDVNLLEDDPKAMIKKNLERQGSLSSSTAHSGYYGAEGNMYNLKEGEDYGSTAQLMNNQGHAGSNGGHVYDGSNMSSATLNGSLSLPPTVHNSPDTYPAQVRGLQGVQDIMRGQGGVTTATMLAQMGPIGTSPDVFAQRMMGRNGTIASGNGEKYETDGRASPATSGYRVQGTAKSPLGPQGVAPLQGQLENGYQQEDGYYSHQNGQDGQMGMVSDQQQGDTMMYSGAGLEHRPSSQAQGGEGLEYPPAPAMQRPKINTDPPIDLSAYAPYHQDDSARHLASPEFEHQDQSRHHSFSDVYEAYYVEHDEQDAYVSQSNRGSRHLSSYQRGSYQPGSYQHNGHPQEAQLYKQQHGDWHAESDGYNAMGVQQDEYAMSRVPSSTAQYPIDRQDAFYNPQLQQTQRGPPEYQQHNAHMYDYQSR